MWSWAKWKRSTSPGKIWPFTIAGTQSHASGAVMNVNGGSLNLNSNAGSAATANLTMNVNAAASYSPQFRAVRVGVIELPGVLGEVSPPRERRVGGDGLPALMPQAARAEHRVELRVPRSRCRGMVEAVGHADALDG